MGDSGERAVEPTGDGANEGAVLRARGIHRWLGSGAGRVHVLKGIDLDLYPGETYAVAGPSGCGKSTLLYLLGLLDRPDQGEIGLAGVPSAGAVDSQRTALRNQRIGFVFQFHFLLPEFSALENVQLPMRKRGALAPAAQLERAASLLEEVGLGDKLGRLAGALSGGERQRVAIARALANGPSLILADEPTGNLDGRNSEAVFDLLNGVTRRYRTAVLMVTHNSAMAARCGRTLTMVDGRFEG